MALIADSVLRMFYSKSLKRRDILFTHLVIRLNHLYYESDCISIVTWSS